MGKNLERKNLNLKRAKKGTEEATAASSSNPPPPWTELPREVTADILHRLGAHDILASAEKVCTTWLNVCKDPSMWRVIDMRNLREYLNLSPYLETVCHQAVDRSEGQLTDVYIDDFADDELLQYISERSSQLKCLRLRGCHSVSGNGLRDAAKRFPLLEEVYFVSMQYCSEDIVAIGRSCPKLRSLTLSESGYKHPRFITNDNALAIAKSMPGLRQLRLLGNNMKNEHLEAILDGCPLLESLDIHKCNKVNLSGDLGKRIAQKIKHFKHPFDLKEDCECSTRIFDIPEHDDSSGFSDIFSFFDYCDY